MHIVDSTPMLPVLRVYSGPQLGLCACASCTYILQRKCRRYDVANCHMGVKQIVGVPFWGPYMGDPIVLSPACVPMVLRILHMGSRLKS